jgi:hypothetical protein
MDALKFPGVTAALLNLSGAMPSNIDKKYKGFRALYILLGLRRTSILKQGVFDITVVPAVHFVTAVNVFRKGISGPSSCQKVCLLTSSMKAISILLYPATVMLNLYH